ncbi:hypothetical protein AMK59_3650 [Oryctes borbonicus]|uniref:THAP-type domain-containing protein n=1 Tax=Oryctes borbonicus TaxID=1629725 RepID=A0A0T6B4U5_9SCAR|nr:hypothetical protein AMK59_3650 [Oryctes borbonicus]
MVKTCTLCKKYSTKEQRSFHLLPRNEERKRKWVEILNLQFPSKSTYICSDHFNKEDIVLDVADRAKLKVEATPLPYYTVTPEVKVEYVEGEIEIPVAPQVETIYVQCRDIPSRGSSSETLSAPESPLSTISTFSTSQWLSSRENPFPIEDNAKLRAALTAPLTLSASANMKNRFPTTEDLEMQAPKKKRKFTSLRYFGDCKASEMNDPVKAELNWQIAKKVVTQQKRKIKTLQQSNRRLTNRVIRLKALISVLKAKNNHLKLSLHNYRLQNQKGCAQKY